MTTIDITKPGYVSDEGPIETSQGGSFPGKLRITASRTSGVSPCTIQFSARTTTRAGYDSHQVLGTGGTTNIGYSWDFDDPNSGNFRTKHATNKNVSVGGFAAGHTFEVADGGGSKTFTVMCRAKDAAGNEATASINVTVQAQDDYYSAANTIAVSNTLSTALDWSAQGYDRSPPSGYTEYTSIEQVGNLSGGVIYWPDVQGKRIMLYRGDDFSAEGLIAIRNGNDNFHITWFGNEESGTVITESGSTISFTAPASSHVIWFDAGTTAFVATETVTGGTSLNTATVDEVVILGGDWATNDAEGYLVVSSESGTFTDNESLSGSIAGAATCGIGPYYGNSETVRYELNKGIAGTISDTAAGLGGLTVGAEIDIIGAAANNSRWKVHEVVSASEVKIRYDSGVLMTTAAANGSCVITERTIRPEVDEIKPGTKAAQVANPEDADVASAATAFGNDGWIENMYVDGIRFREFDPTITWQHITIHDCDCDHTLETDATVTWGSIGLPGYNYARNNPSNLDPDIVPYANGYYISECAVIGGTIGAWDNTTGPTPNVNTLGEIALWPTLIGCRYRCAGEHNFRAQGYQDLLIHDMDMLGQHIGRAGGKHRITIRGAGCNIVTALSWDGEKVGAHMEPTNTDTGLYPASRWSCSQYVWDDPGDIGQGSFSGIEAADELELHIDGLITHWEFNPNATQAPSQQILFENVQYCCCTSLTGLSGTGVLTDNTGVLNNGPNNVIINGTKSTQSGYLGPSYQDGDGETAYVLPVPTAPR